MIANRRSAGASFLILSALIVLMCSMVPAQAEVRMIKGQTVYVPAYSEILQGNKEQTFLLSVTLSIRNTDPSYPITILSVDYHGDDGKLIRSYVQREAEVGPLASTYFFVKESDKSGGLGSKFIVKWKSRDMVTEPIIETVMISTNTQQGISFTSRGQAIQEELK
jgi:hypothetical protein